MHICLDSSLMRAHKQAATGKGGGQKWGFRLWGLGKRTDHKIHMPWIHLADRSTKLTPRQHGDAHSALVPLEGRSPRRVLTEKGR